ncbi:MAG TPA: ABC transporter substrate-binding protein [Chloroflexota bacterium]|nr:ABC transporter substrate-binding protein [Chloroflexota bacterium]
MAELCARRGPWRRGAVALVLGALLAAAACAPTAAPASKPAGAPPGSAPTASGASAPTAGGATSAPSAGSSAAPTPIAVRVAWAAPGGALTPVWVAYEQGILREQGLDAELVFLSGTRTDQGVVTGDTPIGFGANTIPTRLAGADIVAIAGVINRLSYTLFANPSSGVRAPQDLRGKTMVGTLPGSSSTSATLITLRHFGLEPGRDVQIQPTQGTPEQLTLVTQGLADASLFSPPTNLKALDLGLVPVANVTELNIPFMQTAIGITPAWGREHGEEVRRFLRAYVKAVAVARRDADGTKAAIGKYTQTDDQAVLDETYRYYRELWGQPDFRVPPEAVASILQVMDLPGAATANPTDFVDNHFIEEIAQSGWMEQVGALQ